MTLYDTFKKKMQRIADLNNTASVLSWDQETYMPELGAEHRSQQQATLAGISHTMSTEKELGELLKKLSDDKTLTPGQQKNVALTLKDYEKRKKYTTEFVEKISQTVSQCFVAWQKAKHENNFSLYAPHLEKLVELKREESEFLGYEKHPYDAQLDMYEPEATTAQLEKLFGGVREKLVAFVNIIKSQPQNNDDFMYKHFPKDKQWDYGIMLLKQMGYNFKAGRQDLSTHPFSTSFSPLDVRVTTRMNENDLSEMMWSCIHEGGHALYEQGMPVEEYGLPGAEAISLSIHESQSRLWENNVGRSLNYWKHNFKSLQNTFPDQLKNLGAEDFYKAMNIVKPSFIRTSADELTYHFHVMVRFEIEKALFEKSVNVKELPELWNAKYKEYLGVDVPSDAKGVLQDIHWSHGSFGYFPTYSLGSFYAAQFYAQAKKEIQGLENEISNGNMKPLLSWLREKVHKHGRHFTSEELCIAITGEKLNFDHFMNYANEKYSHLYKLKTSAAAV